MRLLQAVLGLSFFAATTMAAAGIAPDPILAAAPSQFVASDGARVHYKIVGRGKNTIVFLHGAGGDMNVWREQVAALQSKARLILIDLPGHGQSEAPASSSMRTLARAVSAVLRQTHSESAIIVGRSMGALVAREVDRLYPAHCRALVAVDVQFESPEAWSGEKMSIPFYAVVRRSAHTDDSDLQFLRSLGTDVTVDVIDDEPAELNTKLEKWLAAHKWIR